MIDSLIDELIDAAALVQNQTVRQWLQALASQHGFNALQTELSDQNTCELLSDHGADACTTLADRTLRLSALVMFRVDLPVGPSKPPDPGQAPLHNGQPPTTACHLTTQHSQRK